MLLHCFQFVNFHDAHQSRHDPDGAFALAALMEIPNQFAAMTDLGYFNNNNDGNVGVGSKRQGSVDEL